MAGARDLLRIHPGDNVAVALRSIDSGETVSLEGEALRIMDGVPRGHKVCLRFLSRGETVVKYGCPAGRARSEITPGAWIHDHNVESAIPDRMEHVYEPAGERAAPLENGLAFEGYLRPDGAVGIRNEIWVIPLVGCVNKVAESLARAANAGGLPAGVDGVHAFPHPLGCSQLGDDLARTRKILAGLARHPNAAGVLLLGLGCENNTAESFRAVLAGADSVPGGEGSVPDGVGAGPGDADSKRYRFLTAQEAEDEMASGLALIRELAEAAKGCRRGTVPVSRLRVGLKCGGSDAFSGLTANPLVGAVADRLVARGAACALTEVPEIFGAEAILLNRCASREVFQKAAEMIEGFKAYYLRHGEGVRDNPSPGNLAGGISTLEEKSLGCIQKGGTTPVTAVLNYGERMEQPGLNLLEGPGNDMVAVTALAAAGAHLILFTTGLGTPLGGPVPTLKIASRTALAERKKHWIDFDAGVLLEGASLPGLADRLLRQVLECASGKLRTRSEEHGCRDISIWKDGVTL